MDKAALNYTSLTILGAFGHHLRTSHQKIEIIIDLLAAIFYANQQPIGAKTVHIDCFQCQ